MFLARSKGEWVAVLEMEQPTRLGSAADASPLPQLSRVPHNTGATGGASRLVAKGDSK